MKPYRLLPLIAAFLFSAVICHGKGASHQIMVSQDFTEALAKVLTAETNITVKRAIPPSYSPDVHTAYLKKHQSEFTDIAQQAEAVLTAVGAWPDDPLYPRARRANIRIVPIDITMPLDRTRAGVPLIEMPATTSPPYPIWNSPGKCARMADIAAYDLIHLFESEKEQIEKNRDNLKRDLFALRTGFEAAFGELEAFEIIALTTDFLYLTDEFGISVVRTFLKPEYKWSQEDVDLLRSEISNYDIGSVLAKWEPNKTITKAITDKKANIIVPKAFRVGPHSPPKDQLLDFYQNNLILLLEGLSSSR